jgi:hypothetical protein
MIRDGLLSGQRVAATRARRASSSASAISTANGRIAVAPAELSVVAAMWILLGEVMDDPTKDERRVRTSHPSKPWVCSLGFCR